MLNNLVKKDKYYYISLILFVIFGLMLVLAFHVNSPIKVYADYQDVLDDPNAIVNFNQLANYYQFSTNYYSFSSITNDGYVTITLPNQSVWWARLPFGTVIDDVSTHYLYIRQDNNKSYDLSLYYDSSTNPHDLGELDNNTSMILSGHTDYGFSFHNASASTFPIDLRLIVIDVTLMFGSGNEPNLQECNELFVADYYQYTIGSAVSLSGLNSYAEGVQSVYDTLTYNYVAENSYDLLQPYAFYRGATYYNGAPSKEQSNISVSALDGDGWVSGNGFALYYPFNSSLVTGDTITLNGMLGSATDYGTHQQATIYIIIRYGENIYDVLSVDAIVLQNTTTNNINSYTYTLPSDATGLVFYSMQPFRIKDFTIQVRSLSINNLIDSARKNGYEKAEEEYKAYYSQGGAGYQAIYNKGYYAYPTDDHFTFQSLIASAVDVPVQAFINLFDFEILGINMKTLYASLLTLLVIVCIVRLVL